MGQNYFSIHLGKIATENNESFPVHNVSCISTVHNCLSSVACLLYSLTSILLYLCVFRILESDSIMLNSLTKMTPVEKLVKWNIGECVFQCWYMHAHKNKWITFVRWNLLIVVSLFRSFHMRVSKHVGLDDDFCRLYPQLYYNRSRQV